MNKFTEILINARLLLLDRPIRVATRHAPIYTVSDGELQIKICRPGRYNRYKRGIKRGIDALASGYHLDTFNGLDGRNFVDRGVNVCALGI